MDKKDLKIIKEVASDLIEKLGFECVVEIKKSEKDEGGGLICDILVENDPNFLIGHRGTNLEALQQLVRVLVGRKTEKVLRFMVDVNSYRQEKNQSILEYANFLAKQAVEEKRVILMRPMNAYERRLVHMELESNDSVVTESVGENEERKVAIKPKSDLI